MYKRLKFVAGFILAFLLCCAVVNIDRTAEVAYAATWGGAECTSLETVLGGDYHAVNNPYKISSAAEYAYVAEQVNTGNRIVCGNQDGQLAKSASYRLCNDIILNEGRFSYIEGSVVYDGQTTISATAIAAIGTGANRFAGCFDGNGYTLSGVYIPSTGDYQGVFGVCAGATIKNLKVDNSFISGENYVSGLVGHARDSTSVINCNVSAIISASEDKVGGIIGNAMSCSVENSVSRAVIYGQYGGGVVGYVAEGGIVKNCFFDGYLYATNKGGICINSAGTLDNNYWKTESGATVGIVTNNSNQNASTVTATVANASSGTDGALVDILNNWITEQASQTDYATWKIVKTKLTILEKDTFQLSYVSTLHASGEVPIDSADYESGGLATVLSGVGLLRSGYTFAGWDTDDDGIVNYTSGDSITVTGNVTLVAVWDKLRLSTPTSLTLEFGVASWSAIDGLGSNVEYKAQLYCDETAVGAEVSTTNTSYDFGAAIQAQGGGEYTFSVYAISASPDVESSAVSTLATARTAYAITLQQGANTTLSANAVAFHNQIVSVTATANIGYENLILMIDNVALEYDNGYTFSMPARGVTLSTSATRARDFQAELATCLNGLTEEFSVVSFDKLKEAQEIIRQAEADGVSLDLTEYAAYQTVYDDRIEMVAADFNKASELAKIIKTAATAVAMLAATGFALSKIRG